MRAFADLSGQAVGVGLVRNARTTFSGDDLMNNFGFSLSGISRKIKWIGENDISETIDY